jgi:hypothetical protein
VPLSGFVSSSGATNFDGSGNSSIAIAMQAPRDLFEGEQSDLRDCECLYGTNGFGLRGEEMEKTQGMSLLKLFGWSGLQEWSQFMY